jgi:uncharacterized protein with FMN-binding domain
MESTKKKDIIVTLAVLLVVVLVVAGAVAFNKKQTGGLSDTASAASTTTPVSTAAAGQTLASTTSTTQSYKDGTYTATGGYATPEDNESITVTVTLKDGAVTSTSAATTNYSRDSREYSNMFLRNYKPLVVGKSITSISLSRVSGSSLTSQGFNDAIEQIKSQARS